MPSKKASVKKGSARKPAKKSGKKPSAVKGKKSATNEPSAKKTKREGKPAGALMENIHSSWDQLSTSERKAVAHCAKAFYDGAITSKRLNGFLNKQEQKKGTGKKSSKEGKQRAPSAFFAFLKNVREDIKSDYPDTSVTDVAVVAGALWKQMDAAQKAKKKVDSDQLEKEIKKVRAGGVSPGVKRKRSEELA